MEHESKDCASLLTQLPKEILEMREELEHESEDSASLLAQLPQEFWEEVEHEFDTGGKQEQEQGTST